MQILELNDIILNARLNNEEDYTQLLPFYDYDLSTTAKKVLTPSFIDVMPILYYMI
jgi:hypothetical protein